LLQAHLQIGGLLDVGLLQLSFCFLEGDPPLFKNLMNVCSPSKMNLKKTDERMNTKLNH